MVSVALSRYRPSKHHDGLVGLLLDEDQFAEWMPIACVNSDADIDYYIDSQFKRYYHEFFVVEGSDSCFLGVVFSHNYRPNDGHAMVSTAIRRDRCNRGYGAMATIAFMDFLFRHYSIRKVFMSVYDYNKRSLNVNLHAGLIEEGRLKEYRYLNGQYHDLHYLSISRERFYDLYSSTLERIGPRIEVGKAEPVKKNGPDPGE